MSADVPQSSGADELTTTPRRSERNHDILVRTNLFLEALIIQDLNMADCLFSALWFDAALIGNEFLQRLEVSAAVVVDRFGAWLAIEPFQGREALDTEALAELFVGIGINVGDGDSARLCAEGGGEFVVDWG